eukprot:TRINITY_DN67544_c0_g1_i1.p1 TRINITY_DN67544_c0_g1~~TRINITY_DN67544_c0_g1_i1.p1  ORF type:complete len:576 (-),score=111.95 TRINITY_DN67544_c0_g1_i1:170-1771(-)
MAAGGALEQGHLTASKLAPGMIAPAAIVKCLQAACSKKSFREGLDVEATEFIKLLFSLQSAALRHLFFAERMAQKVPGIKVGPAKLRKVGIVGSGLMGGGVALCFAEKGIPVVLKDAKQEWLDDGVKKIVNIMQGQVKKKRISKDQFKNRMALIKPTLDYEEFSDVDLVIEAVPEIMELKKQVFLELERACRPDCIICTNTSGLDIDEIAGALKDSTRVMGCHFFSPANVMQLLENVKIQRSSDRTLATGMAMGKLIGKKTVMVKNSDGFVGNRMIAPYASEARMLVEEGVAIEKLDSVALNFGMAMGPMHLGDLVGQELFWKQRKAAGDMKKQTKTYYGPYELVDWLCEKGRFGLKTPDTKIKADGRGIFIHRGRSKHVDPEVVAKIVEIQKMKGISPRNIGHEEIIERLFFPLINEGFKIMEEGIAARASDIDIVYIYGYGFPPAKGGPMFYAENYVGYTKILERLKVYAAQARERYTKNDRYLPTDYFEPSKLLVECAKRQADTEVVPGMMLVDMVRERMSSSPSAQSKL